MECLFLYGYGNHFSIKLSPLLCETKEASNHINFKPKMLLDLVLGIGRVADDLTFNQVNDLFGDVGGVVRQALQMAGN